MSSTSMGMSDIHYLISSKRLGIIRITPESTCECLKLKVVDIRNDHTEGNCVDLPVSGFNSSDILVDPYTYDYWHPGFSRDSKCLTLHLDPN